MKIKRVTAIFVAKMISRFCQAVGKEGATLAGRAALRIDPKILNALSVQVRNKIFAVCGTNGKTTVNTMLYQAVKDLKNHVVCNRSGSNMLPGVTAAFVLQAKWDGSLDADYACLEVDEASAQHIFRFVKPDILILLNLFRDQLDRYGELDHTVNLLKQALAKVPQLQLVVNADDPLVYSLALESGHPILTFGIGQPVWAQPAQREIRDGGFCRKCGTRLDYQYYQFGQLGCYTCPGCGFSRPAADYEAASISLEHGITFKVGNYTFQMPGRGVYTIYNMLAACCAGRAAGLQMERLQAALAAYRVPNGRMEAFRISGKEIILNLAKNPAGFNQNLEALRADPAEKEILIVIHDQAADGRDISWLWDVEFERLHTDTVHAIKACGIRALDLQLRMKYEDLRSECIPDVRRAVRESLASQAPVLYILVNYTALFPVRTFLQKLQKRSLYFSEKRNRNQKGNALE